MRRVLVTGGAGFIGSHIVDFLLAGGNEVLVLDNLSSGKREYVNAKARLEVDDIRNPSARALVAAFKPQVIVHAAAQISVRISMDDPRLDADINVVGMVNLLDAFRFQNLPHFVFISTGGAIYGEQEKFPADESHPARPNCIYGQSKRVAEIYLEFWNREFNMPFTALRLGNVYGPRQNPHGEAGVVAIFAERLLRGEQPIINGAGTQTRDFVYVGDVARAVAAVVQEKCTGTFNIGTGKETSVNLIYSTLCQACGQTPAAKHGPAKLGEQMRSCISARAAREAFAWEPQVTIEKGLAETVAWFRQQKNRAG